MNASTKSKLRLHIVKRSKDEGGRFADLKRYGIAILIALLCGGLFILCVGENPFTFFATMISGCFKSKLSIFATIRIIVPLLITSLGVSLAFRMRFWNIGAEGQFIMGAVAASWVALFHGDLPAVVLLPLMIIAGAIGGGLWGLIAAFFNSFFGTNETLLTLMLNYIALYIVQWLRDGPWRDPAAGGFPKIAKLPENGWVPSLFGLDISWIIAILLCIGLYIYVSYTKQGYEISVVGDSVPTARYAGMNVRLVVLRTMFISAAICGIAGMLQVAGDATSRTLTIGIANGVGFTAIIVAWLAKLSPIGMLGVSVLFGILEKGCGVAESTYGTSSAVSDIFQGIILFVILGADFFIRYKLVLRHETISGDNDNNSVEAAQKGSEESAK